MSRNSGIGILCLCVMLFNLLVLRASRSSSDVARSTATLDRAPLFSNSSTASELQSCKAPEVVIEGETAEFWHMEDPQVLSLSFTMLTLCSSSVALHHTALRRSYQVKMIQQHARTSIHVQMHMYCPRARFTCISSSVSK
jgi:hypothetical protein